MESQVSPYPLSLWKSFQHRSCCAMSERWLCPSSPRSDKGYKLLDEVAHGVEVEPRLQSLSGEVLPPGANVEAEARLDFAGKGFLQQSEMVYFDVKVFSPFSRSHLNVNLDSLFKRHQSTKKTKYNERVIKVDHGSFTPVGLSAYGGFGRKQLFCIKTDRENY